MNYFRITAYNREEDYSIIMDSYGAFNELWQFSSCLVNKGFSIIAVEMKISLKTEIYLK